LPIPRIDGDILIPAIPISACDPSTESSKNPSTRSSASASRIQASTRKAPIDPNPPKKAKKIFGKPSGRFKIIGPKQKAPASTPQSGTSKGSQILRCKGYAYRKYFLLPFVVNLQTSIQSAPRYPFGLSCKEYFNQERVPKGGQAPESLLWKTIPETPNLPCPKDINVPTSAASNPASPSAVNLSHDADCNTLCYSKPNYLK
jgi:hypothetical protein